MNTSLIKLTPNSLIYLYNYIAYKIRYPRSHISPRSFLKNVKLGKNNYIAGGNVICNSSIGDFTYFSGSEAGGVHSYYLNTTIGKFCALSYSIKTIPDDKNKDYISSYPFNIHQEFKKFIPKDKKFIEKGSIEIGNDVWIGVNVVILKNIKIGDGAVIGAGAIVTKDVEPYTVVGGCPAKLIKYRYNKQDRKKLLKIQWWNWPEEKIAENLNKLLSSNVNSLYNFYGRCIDKNRKT